ncbi:MAG: 50S ribosomal protein L30 [Deltaproteobacteria bacterium]|nr:50S ribosomal protein L30 [Deltaproteobacteria bacterium]
MSARKVRIKQVRSGIGQRPATKATLHALGLGRIGKAREFALTPSLEGMAKTVAHLVHIEEVSK